MNWFNSLSGSRAKANELEAANTSLVAERDAAVTALKAEQEANTAALAAFKTEIEALTQANAAMTKDVEAAQAAAVKAAADAEKATTDFAAKVKEAAARKAQDINAALGVPPVSQADDSNRAKGDKKLTRAQFKALSHDARNQFMRSGGKVTE